MSRVGVSWLPRPTSPSLLVFSTLLTRGADRRENADGTPSAALTRWQFLLVKQPICRRQPITKSTGCAKAHRAKMASKSAILGQRDNACSSAPMRDSKIEADKARAIGREDATLLTLVDMAKLRWRIERDYQEVKSELGLSHFEGRGWRGFHHHAMLCIAPYGFLIRERAAIPPLGPTQREKPRLSCRRGCSERTAATRAPCRQFGSDASKAARIRAHQNPVSMPMLQGDPAVVHRLP